jgi:hypothetical protein
MRKNKFKVRLWVIGPFLFYFFIFLLWFPRWQHASHSFSTRLLSLLFEAMTAVLMVLAFIGGFFSPLGWGPFVHIAMDAYNTFLKKDSDGKLAMSPHPSTSLTKESCPDLVITKQLKDGTPVRGACPLCDVEFSTEAFREDRSYPHENTLNRWYGEHLQYHIVE